MHIARNEFLGGSSPGASVAPDGSQGKYLGSTEFVTPVVEYDLVFEILRA